uniref:CRAL-TRIO domain-containing protein n=1 Tax=Dendroctonus ponderosae TaxID=77166 RepID=J3JXX5_DENPD|nr:unknown [Dendroctonus ponderosae]
MSYCNIHVLSMNNLSEDARRYALENLNETDENRRYCLENIRLWLQNDVPWIKGRSEDKYILPFLRGCKFNLTKTKMKLKNYYMMKRDRPEWFSNRNPLLPEIQALVKLGAFVPLKHTQDNKMVIIIRTAAHDPKIHTWNDVFKVGKMILDVACQEIVNAQIFGVIAIFDMTGMGFTHYKSMTPTLIKNVVFAWRNYHVRPKQLEYINSPTYINIALRIFKSFMTEKMRGRVKVHFGGVEEAQTIVAKDILPVEYGGSGESLNNLSQFWVEQLLKYRDWFAEDEFYKAEQTEASSIMN